MMDDAMLRRLPRKFFVGRPSNVLREKAFSALRTQYNIPFESGCLENLLLITMNYHGAALNSICSRIRYKYNAILEENIRPSKLITHKDIVEMCSSVSTSYQIQIGPFVVADIFQDRPEYIRFTKSPKFDLKNCTGRIVVDLSRAEGSVQVEMKNNTVLRVPFKSADFRFASNLVPTYVNFALEQQLEMIQYIDSEVLSSNAAFDEQTIQEILQEFTSEVKGYRKSLLVLDMDSLVGISSSQSFSSMGLSTSYSFSKQNLASWLFSTSKSVMQMGPRGIAHWVVVVISNQFCLDSFKELARFPKSDAEERNENVKKQDETEAVTCKNCERQFLRSENKPLECHYHLHKANRNDPHFDPDTFVHVCCGSKYQVNSVSGCKQGYHQQ